MRFVGYVLTLTGLAMALLDFTGAITLIPRLARIEVPLTVWIALFLVGGFIVMMTRQTRD